MRQKFKITPNSPKNESGLTQLIRMGESIRQIWVKHLFSCYGSYIDNDDKTHPEKNAKTIKQTFSVLLEQKIKRGSFTNNYCL